MNINPKTYDDIKGAYGPHDLGEVWCQMLWDLFWEFIEVYGYDPDYTNTDFGNYKALLIILDGI